jgi:membrane protease YdiL (CAAX protease family)
VREATSANLILMASRIGRAVFGFPLVGLSIPSRMLFGRPWKSDAVARLVLSVFICIYAGSLVVSTVHYSKSHALAWDPLYLMAGGALVCLAFCLGWMRRPWTLEKAPGRIGVLMGGFYAALFLGYWVMKTSGRPEITVLQMVIAAISFQASGLVLVALLLREHGAAWDEAFGFCHQWPRALAAGLVAATLFLPAGWGLQFCCAQALDFFHAHWPQLGFKPELQQSVQTLKVAQSFLDRFALAGVTILLAPLAEEMIFRGILYPWIKQLGFPRLALWITSLVFAGMHQNAISFLPLLLLALLLVWLYERTANLLAPIAAHSLFNALNFVALYLAERQM